MKRRKLAKEYAPTRLRLVCIKRCKLLPQEIRVSDKVFSFNFNLKTRLPKFRFVNRIVLVRILTLCHDNRH